MKLKTKLPLFSSTIVLVSIFSISAFSIYSFQKRTMESINLYRIEETEQIKQELKDIVNIAWAMINQSYKSSSKEGIEKTYGLNLSDTSDQIIKMIAVNTLNITLNNLRALRYGSEGYIWINSIEPPYTVIMHATRPEMEGKAHVIYVEDSDINIYDMFAEAINKGGGAGFVRYKFYKPGTDIKAPKISYVKLYEPLGWVIGTGVYVDHIDKMVATKKAELEKQIERIIEGTLVIGLFLIAISTIILYVFGKRFIEPLYEIQEVLGKMAKGERVEKIELDRKDEIGQMKNSLDKLIEGFSRYTKFAIEVGSGNFVSDFKPLSKKDILGNTLLEMRNSLKKAREEEEKRNIEAKKRQWINEGLARLSEILRGETEDIYAAAEAAINYLVSYTNSTQGGIFILNKDEENNAYLEQVATIAYNRIRKRFKRIKPGDGLIGAVFLEKEPFYLTKIPDNYFEIKSGLGSANPRNLFIIPMFANEEIIGVVEIASFNIYEPYQLEFIENAVDSIAASIRNIIITRSLRMLK